jgi:hypothetical protein
VLYHIGRYMCYLLCQDGVKKLNFNGIQALDVDLTLLQRFEASLVGTRRHLDEARQMVAVFQANDLSEFMDPAVRRSKYNLVRSRVRSLVTRLGRLLLT